MREDAESKSMLASKIKLIKKMISNERKANELISNHLSYLTADMLSNERSGRKSATQSYKSQKI